MMHFKFSIKKKLVLFFLTLLFLSKGFTQTPENLAVHFDKTFYVAGEDVWFKLYIQDTVANIHSKVIRVEWLNPEGQLVMTQKLQVENNYALGDLAIPYDWSEGNYLFRAYTVWNLNFEPVPYLEQVMPIYNLLEIPPIAAQSSEILKPKERNDREESELKISLKTRGDSYHKREDIIVEIRMTDKEGNPIEGNFSIAITDGNYFGETDNQSSWKTMKKKRSNNFKEAYSPEKGIELLGTLLDQEGKPLNTRFLSIYFPSTKTFERFTVSKGRLKLTIPAFQGSQPIQFFDMNPFHEPIPTLELPEIKLINPYNGKPLLRTEEVANYLFLLSKYRQYRETFDIPSPDYGPAFLFEKRDWVFDKSWEMEQYTALSDLASFASEIISAGRVVGKGDQRSIRLQYAEKSIYNNFSPWYLVNGCLTEDEVSVLKMPFREIEKIDMYNSKKSIAKQLDPSMVSRGMLVIHTKDGKVPDALTNKPNNLDLAGYYPLRQFPKQAVVEEQVPDFRPVIYWNPIIKTDFNGLASFRFKATDGIGRGQIKVVGQSLDGKIGTGELTYKVSFE